MMIILNGLEEKVPDNLTVEELIAFVREEDPHVIVEQNGRYIYPKDYTACVIRENDKIELINPNLGG